MSKTIKLAGLLALAFGFGLAFGSAFGPLWLMLTGAIVTVLVITVVGLIIILNS